MLFNNVELSTLINISNVERGMSSEIALDTAEYIRRHGSYIKQRRYDSRKIVVSFWVSGQIQQKLEALKRVLFVSKPVEIIFGDETDRFYLGLVSSSPTFEKRNNQYAQGSFEIYCAYPFAQSVESKMATINNNKIVFKNNGSMACYPKFECVVSSDIKMLAFVHPNGNAIQLGSSAGEPLLFANNRVVIDTSDLSVFVNGKRMYVTPSSKRFSIEHGEVTIGVSVNDEAQLPQITATFKEVYV